jgi:hypothetical protein
MPSCTGNGCFVEVHVHSTVGSQIYMDALFANLMLGVIKGSFSNHHSCRVADTQTYKVPDPGMAILVKAAQGVHGEGQSQFLKL